MVPSGPCWVCGASGRDVVWSEPFDLSAHPRFGRYAHEHHPESRLVRCRRCGFGQPEELPGIENYFDLLYSDQPWLTPEGMEHEYNCGYKDFIFRDELRGLERRLGAGVPRTVLDVGTHVGRFLELAQREGWEAEGVELNTRAAEFAARRTGLPVHQVKAQELSAQGRRFGAVVLTDVLEHIPFPQPLVTDLRGLLHPGGGVAVKVPHGPPQRFKETLRGLVHRGREAREARRVGVMTRFVHVNHFTVASLRLCLETAGFARIEVAVAPLEFTPASPSRTRAQAILALARPGIYRAAKLIPGGVHSPLSFNLLAYGINPGTCVCSSAR